MGRKSAPPPIVVTDAGTGNNESRVTDMSTRVSVVVPTTVAGIAQGIKDVAKKDGE